LDAGPAVKMCSSCGSAAAIVMMSLLAVTSVAAAQQPSLPSRPMLIASDAMTGFVTEASQRFGVPDAWIRAAMQVESAGDSSSTSPAGAMGLMQVMPQTYAMLRARLSLGANPYDPHDNIMAGAAYLRDMHDRYGSTGFLAAYNAGPGRFEEFRAGVRPLPAETVHYLARLNPMLGIEGPTMLADANLAVTHVPATSPIFVRLPPPSGATGLQSSGQQNMQVAAADMPTDLQTGSLFAARSTAAFPSRSQVETAPQSPSGAPSNTMFIQRRASRAAP
jgi:hypothetical protein